LDRKLKPLRVIIFVVTCLIFLVFIYLLVFRIDFGGSTKVSVRFGAVGTIQSGSPVRQSGVKVGSVSRVVLAADDRRKVDVELALYPGLVIRTDDRISIVTGGLLGDQYIDIGPGKPDAPPLAPDQRLEGQSGLDLKVLVDGGGSLIQELSTTSRTISTFLISHSASLDQIVADAQRGIRAAANAAERADRILAKAEENWDPAAKDFRTTLQTLKETSISLKSLVDGLASPGAVVGLLSSPATARSTTETLNNLQSASRSLKEITDAMEKALK